jgi:hypothetical protein
MKEHLENVLPKKQLDMLEIVEYDPGIPGKDILPDRNFEMIISSDVLEHVEPECIDETIAWMQAHTTRFLYHHIACDPAGITLPDGRNVHLITGGWISSPTLTGNGCMPLTATNRSGDTSDATVTYV